jgi:predicted peptidase
MKTFNASLCLLLAFLSIVSAQSALALKISEQSREDYAEKTEDLIYTNALGQTMPYRLFVPADYDPSVKYPLLLSLHGAGSRGSDNLKHLRPWVAGWMDDAVQEMHPCIILMPQCPKGQQWVDTPWRKGSYSYAKAPISTPMNLAKEIFDKVVREKSIDQTRIYVMGASMGGYGAWYFTMRYPGLVAAAVPICGGGDPSMAESLQDIPIWAFHGNLDDTVPPSASHDMADAIKKAGGRKIKLTVYEGVKHGSYKLAWREPELPDWVFRQRKMDSRADKL